MSDKGDDERLQPPARLLRLRMSQRVIASIFGACLIGVGGWAQVMNGKDGAGTVAFVLSGALLLLLGLVGLVPPRISNKDMTIDLYYEWVERRAEEKALQKVKEAAEESLDSMPREVKDALADSAPLSIEPPRSSSQIDSSPVGESFFATLLRGARYEKAALRKLEKVADDLGLSYVVEEGGKQGVDGWLVDERSKKLAVGIKNRFNGEIDGGSGMTAIRVAREDGADGLLLITPERARIYLDRMLGDVEEWNLLADSLRWEYSGNLDVVKI